MTRDQACRILRRRFEGPIAESFDVLVEQEIDRYVALGMLRLDEPKSARDRLEEAMRSTGGQVSVHWLNMIIDSAGLKLVEK